MSDVVAQLIAALPCSLNGYQFVKLVGQGSCGSVFEVYSERYRQTFAIKVTHVDDSLVTPDGNLRDPEIGALFNLDNPYIIRFYDYFLFEEYLFLVLEYCEHGTLQQVVTSRGIALPLAAAHQIISELCRALYYCHEQNIAHRDIKPSNVFIDMRMHIKLADFDLSSFSMDKVTTRAGSPNYAAPEMFTEREFDPYKADVFSLGVTFYEICVGHLPFAECDLVKDTAVEYPDIGDRRLMHVISLMLSHDPAKRPTMRQLVERGSELCLLEPLCVPRQRSHFERNSLPKTLLRKAESVSDQHIPIGIPSNMSQPHLLKSAARRLMGHSAKAWTDRKQKLAKNPTALLEKLCKSCATFDVTPETLLPIAEEPSTYTV